MGGTTIRIVTMFSFSIENSKICWGKVQVVHSSRARAPACFQSRARIRTTARRALAQRNRSLSSHIGLAHDSRGGAKGNASCA